MHSIEGKDYIAALPFQVSAVLFLSTNGLVNLFARCGGWGGVCKALLVVAAQVLHSVGESDKANESAAVWSGH